MSYLFLSCTENEFLTDDGVQISVMKYRNKLKGPDPYPEDYFDKKKVSE